MIRGRNQGNQRTPLQNLFFGWFKFCILYPGTKCVSGTKSVSGTILEPQNTKPLEPLSFFCIYFCISRYKNLDQIQKFFFPFSFFEMSHRVNDRQNGSR